MSVAQPDKRDQLSTVGGSGLDALMQRIRPAWQSKGLIERVYRLIPVDLSSACQRLFNAAIQDLREKIKIAGSDIASEVAVLYKLPPVASNENIDDYSTKNIIDLSYRMGLLSRAEWRRVSRSYEIRRDLEHEDSEYEASPEDGYYIFSTSIDAVLSKDPVAIIRVPDIKDLIDAPGPAIADEQLKEDFEHAPEVRQLEILKLLLSKALDENEPELVRSNGFTLLGSLTEKTGDPALLKLSQHFQNKMGRKGLSLIEMRVAHQAKITPYLRKAQKREFYKQLFSRFESAGFDWRSNEQHGKLLSALLETGGLRSVTEEELTKYLKWMTLCFVGEPGGYGAGKGRRVFYSNSAAPLIRELFRAAQDITRPILETLSDDTEIKLALNQDKYVDRRFDQLLDFVEPPAD